MARALFQVVIALALPFALYAAWLAMRRRQAPRRGGGKPIAWRDAPWTWLTVAGVLLAIASLAMPALLESDRPDGVYVPPRVEPDGRVVPGHIEPRRP